MCDEDEEDSGPEFKKMNVASGSDGTPRGHLKDRVSFFEQVWSPRSQRRLETSGDDSSFEESYERLVEEGELNGAKVVKFEKITVRKSLKEMSVAQEVRGVGACESCRTTPSDSAYQSHGHAGHQGSSKGSSVTSFGRFPSEDSLLVHSKRAASPRTPSTWKINRRPNGTRSIIKVSIMSRGWMLWGAERNMMHTLRKLEVVLVVLETSRFWN